MWPVLARHAHKIKFLLNENSTTILTGVGVVGTVGTAVLTGRASFKAADVLSEKTKELNDGVDPEIDRLGFSKTEKVKLVWPYFLPPIAVGGGTVAAIVMANRISSKQIAALAIASGVSERAFQEYKEKVLEKLGDRQETAIQDEIAQDQVTNNPPSGQVIIAGSGDVLCFEPLTGRYFNSTIETVKAAENKVNYEIIHFEYCSLSHFFDEIGLAPTDYSDMVGWNVANRMEVKFSTTMSEDKRPCLVVGYLNTPSMDYNKSWT
jgi:Family of unknown function (DUF6353)